MKIFKTKQVSSAKSQKNRKSAARTNKNKASAKGVVVGKGPNIKSYRRFSNRRALLVVAGMVVIGIGTLIYTLAATTNVDTPIEAERMSWTRGSTQKWLPQNITGKALYWNASGTGTVELPVNATTLTVYVRGDQCNGAPQLVALLDGKQIMKKDVTSKNWTKYSVSLDPKVAVKGKHAVALGFSNDYGKRGVCDRNLYIDKVVFSGLKEVPVINPAPKPGTPATTPAPKYNPNAQYNIIMIGWRPYEKDYAQLANNNTNLVYRSIDRTPQGNKAKLELWDSMGYKYFNNVAGSDWASSGKGGACSNVALAYMDKAYSEELLKRSNNIGYYMHEMVSLNAACNGWNWPAAANSLDWAKINDYILRAKAQNKKVIWSEPAQGWNAIRSNQTFQSIMPYWKGTLVPMFATNFKTATYDHVPTARDGAVAAAQQLSSPSGESVQSWYFRESTAPLNVNSTVALADMGLQAGSTYYQIEGTYNDMAWGTDYMKGVLAFSQKLGTKPGSPNTPANPAPAPKPQTPTQTTPVSIPKKPLYQLWNNVTSDHLYTTDAGERNQLIAGKQYVDQGIAGYLYEKQAPGSTPLYRVWVASATNNFYTASQSERDNAVRNGGTDKGIVGYIMTTQAAGSTPFYRLYSASYPDHYYTADVNAKNSANASFRSYKDEGTVGFIFTKP